MKNNSRVYSASIYLGWSIVLVFTAVVSGITLDCYGREFKCDRHAINSLWGDVVVGVFALIAASTPALMSHSHDLNKGNQTNEKRESEA